LEIRGIGIQNKMQKWRSLIENWTENDLLDLPEKETDSYEYKSSKTSKDDLNRKLSIAASAFWNSGGGLFIAGVDDGGKIDGGIPANFGRQSLQDWIAQIILQVEPSGLYTVKIIQSGQPNSAIATDNVVLVVAFEESLIAPYMAYDKRYYIRAGAHSVSASHFWVEAIRLRRNLLHPRLHGLIRMHPQKDRVIELEIIALNQAPALDVKLSLNPLPAFFEQHARNSFPLSISIVDINHPFTMEISVLGSNDIILGLFPMQLILDYYDVTGRLFNDTQSIDVMRNIPPLQVENTSLRENAKVMKQIGQDLKALRQILEQYLKIKDRETKNVKTQDEDTQ
jgi:Putative DNA-binding domain